MTEPVKQTTDAMAELTAMTEVAKALQFLDAESVRRVLRWATDRFGTAGIITTRQSKNAEEGEQANENQVQVEGGTGSYSSIADLYTAAKPKVDSEKALVVAYWIQRSTGQGDFEAATINKELKHLGHGVANITAALSGLITRRPQLVIQTRKTGNSQQSRKLYKLTNEGLKYVDHMIQGED